MTKVETSEQDLHFSGEDELKMAAETENLMDEDKLWLDDEDDDVNQNQDSLLDEASIFYNDFPPLPDFPCMSSSSSSSPSTPAAAKPPSSSSSSSSAASSSPSATWTVLNSDITSQHLSSTASMEIPPPPPAMDDVMENLQYIDLLEGSNEMWDPSCIFQNENPPEFNHHAPPQPPQTPGSNGGGGLAGLLEGNAELSLMFFEWLKQNKDHVSAEDMRSIKFRKSTIDSATKRLGTTKEGQKMLLKLILDWVQQHLLQKKRALNRNPNPNPNFNIYNPLSPDPVSCFPPASPWNMPPPPPTPPTPMYPMPGYSDPYSTPYPSTPYPSTPYPSTPYPNTGEYCQGMEQAPQSWGMMPMVQQQQMQFNHYPENHRQAVYGSPFYDPKLVSLGPSATKEARKKRMAHQRRLHPHPHRHGNNNSSNQHNKNQTPTDNVPPPPRGGVGENVKLVSDSPKGGGVAAAAASDRRQQQQVEQNLKLLLQKVLKQSDVGNLGRIVLPKKEAETHLPELETRDGITIPMEDIGTDRVWNMRYRFWPNNKSRMYLLENTGDFVRVNGLQEGDFIVLYTDTKCGKYMIRGVKVPEPGTKLECKKATKRNGRSLSLAGINSSSPVPIKRAAI